MTTVWLLRREPIDQIAEIVGIWPTFAEAKAAARPAGCPETAVWKPNKDTTCWWAAVGQGYHRGYTDFILEAVEYHDTSEPASAI